MRGRRPATSPTPDPFAGGLPTLDGRYVRLRQPEDRDLPDLLATFGDADALRYWSHGPLADLADARAYLDGIRTGWRNRSLFQWAVVRAEADRLVGTVTLCAWDRANRRAEVGFILRPETQGQGLATDAVRTALAFGFGPMRLHRVEADVDPENAASLRLLARLGFREEGRFRDRWFTFGTWKDSVMLGLLARDVADGVPG